MPPPPSPQALRSNSSKSSASIIGSLAWQAFSFGFGLFNLISLAGAAAIRDGAFTKRVSREEKRALELAQEKYWTLSKSPLPGFRHEFFTLKNGIKLHYVVNAHDEAIASGNIAIFIHGFPDSFLLWRNHLRSPALASHVLVAVDLPGYGGSDGLQRYDADGLLESLTTFILGMRERYLGEGGKVVMVTHDWGAILGTRLASEAKELADRWIICSAIIPQHLQSNVQTHAASAKQMLHTWIRKPFSIRLLKTAHQTLSPVLGQIGRSFYIFAFNLPFPLATTFATMGNFWLLNVMHKAGAGLIGSDGKFSGDLNVDEAADWLAMSTGPGPAQFTPSEELSYPESALRRTKDYGMSEKIRIYRETVGLGVWEKSLETVVALSEISPPKRGSGAGLFEDGPPGALQTPATFVLGKRDMAFERSLCWEGIYDYLTKGSQVLTIEKAGHWLPHQKLGSSVIEECIEWALGGEKKQLKGKFAGQPDVKFMVDK